jgi:hypothetical protein
MNLKSFLGLSTELARPYYYYYVFIREIKNKTGTSFCLSITAEVPQTNDAFLKNSAQMKEIRFWCDQTAIEQPRRTDL